ncbi:MAG: acetolactate synthase small subunit [Acidobacteriota bacterium]|nr:acetolactate synthase small subunit [Acidobacteriota bacterium]
MRHTISILVANQAGELSRIIGLFSGRGYNVDTISVGKTLDPDLSRATIVTSGDERTVEQIVKQCSQLIRVQKVNVFSSPHIEREMALIDVDAKNGAERQEILNLVQIFRAKVVDMSHEKMILEASGTRDKVDTFIELLKPLGVNDVTRTGCVAINRLSPFEKTEEIREEFLNQL